MASDTLPKSEMITYYLLFEIETGKWYEALCDDVPVQFSSFFGLQGKQTFAEYKDRFTMIPDILEWQRQHLFEHHHWLCAIV